VIATDIGAQTPAASGTVGVWRGTSICTVRQSACRDETVVYRFSPINADSVSVDAAKIVNGQEQDMGALTCNLRASGTQITCRIPQGVWRFTIRGDSLVGELRDPRNTKFRDVRTTRAR
jgi:hypothetical protein